VNQARLVVNMGKLKVASFGIGVIGSLTAKYMIEEKKDRLEFVGAFDIDQSKVGKDVGKVIGLEKSIGIKVSDNLDEVLAGDADAVVHTTSSYLDKVYPQIEALVNHRVDVVSSCEELSYPCVVNRKLANKLDLLAKARGVTVLGTGINPGFLMDALPIVLTAPCKNIKSIRITRRMNAATRRIPFQQKVGAGMTTKEFGRAVKEKRISGHVGLEQSMAMLASAIGWKLEKSI